MTGPKCTIVVQRSTDTSDGAGGYTSVWATLVSLKGILLSKQANEKFLNDSTKVVSTYYFQCKYPSTTITEKDRVLYNSDYYQINFVDNVAEKSSILILWLKKVE